MTRELYKRLNEALNNNRNVYMVTIVRCKDDNYVGKKFLKIDEEIIIEDKENEEFYNSLISKIKFNDLRNIVKVGDNIEIIIENIISKPNLIICGGGHISFELASIAKMLEFNITVIDDREEFANRERFNCVDDIICDSFDNALDNIKFNRNSYFVVVTRGHRDDQECIEKILKNEFSYVGMIGSKAKVASCISKLLEKGYTKEEINRINAPIGISIGAKTPAEIAVSIMAQIIQEKNSINISNIDEEILKEIIFNKDDKVLVSILEKRGSSPRGVDAKMLIKNDNSFIGTIGGGIVENVAYKKAIEVLKSKKSYVEIYDLSNSKAAKLGMACGGTIKVLFEYIS